MAAGSGWSRCGTGLWDDGPWLGELRREWLRDLAACDCSALTLRSYAYDLLRWLRFLPLPRPSSRLTLDHVRLSDGQVLLRLGHEPVVIPEPQAGLTRQLIADRHGHAAIGNQGTSPWLFPGGQPGRPISSYQLNDRLRQLGLHPGQDRSTALFQLAADLPAALLARMLGIHIAVAVAWQRASSGDWTSYAADVSRRPST